MSPTTKASDRYFFLTFALYYLVTMTVAFSYSTAEVIGRDGGLRPIAIVHAIFGTVWLLLFVTQTVLVKARRYQWHMLLGKLGLPVMVGVFVTGIVALLRLHLPVDDMPRGLMVQEVGLFTLGLVYAVLGIVYRTSAPSHKRFMLMSMIMLSPAGMGRLLMYLGVPMSSTLVFVVVIFVIPLLSILVYDLVAYRKVFRGTAVGLAIYVANMFLTIYWGGFVVDVVRPMLV